MRTSLLRPLIVSSSFINKISKHSFNKYANSARFIYTVIGTAYSKKATANLKYSWNILNNYLEVECYK